LAALTATTLTLHHLIGRRIPPSLRPDRAVRHLASTADLRPLCAPARRNQLERLGVRSGAVGVPLGRVLLPPRGRTRRDVYAGWEDCVVLVAGPRTNKTTAFAIPALLAAPGAALLTSNKRDALDATRDLRAAKGTVRVFDPQHVAGEARAWWWNPLTYIRPDGGEAEPARASRLAAQLVASTTREGARTDAYFDVEKENLLALLLLAAAAGGRDITAVHRWLTDATDPDPADLLAEAGLRAHERALHALAGLPDRQREGVYGGARAVMSFLLDPDVAKHLLPDAGLPGFDPVAFAHSSDTLYLLSRDGAGGAAPLVAALTVAVTEALEEHATASPGGRLPVPFVGVLDEAANVCRIRDLDALYTHYGSRGIVLMTILQNRAQGEQAWGSLGMQKLWSAATIRIHGGGVDDAGHLQHLSTLIGPADTVHRSETVIRGRRQRTRSVQQRTILTAAELRELPPGRAILFATGVPAALLEPVPWWADPMPMPCKPRSRGTARRRGSPPSAQPS
jgi:type IV secretory pathway TraG/TraD family ATPase VirD4